MTSPSGVGVSVLLTEGRPEWKDPRFCTTYQTGSAIPG